jgi:hypothetical protein
MEIYHDGVYCCYPSGGSSVRDNRRLGRKGVWKTHKAPTSDKRFLMMSVIHAATIKIASNEVSPHLRYDGTSTRTDVLTEIPG